MTEARKGVLAMVATATVWGLSGLYYKALAEVPPIEVLCHRTLWTVVFLGVLLLAQGRPVEVRQVLARPRAWAPLWVRSPSQCEPHRSMHLNSPPASSRSWRSCCSDKQLDDSGRGGG